VAGTVASFGARMGGNARVGKADYNPPGCFLDNSGNETSQMVRWPSKQRGEREMKP